MTPATIHAQARAALEHPAGHAIEAERLLDDATAIDRLAPDLPTPVASIRHGAWQWYATQMETDTGVPAPVTAWVYAAEAYLSPPSAADVAARLRAVARAVIDRAPLRVPFGQEVGR